MDECPFKDILGSSRMGVHSTRIPVLDIALADTLMTIVAAFFIQKFMYPNTPYMTVLILFAILGEILHVVFCVDTRVVQFFK